MVLTEVLMRLSVISCGRHAHTQALEHTADIIYH